MVPPTRQSVTVVSLTPSVSSSLGPDEPPAALPANTIITGVVHTITHRPRRHHLSRHVNTPTILRKTSGPGVSWAASGASAILKKHLKKVLILRTYLSPFFFSPLWFVYSSTSFNEPISRIAAAPGVWVYGQTSRMRRMFKCHLAPAGCRFPFLHICPVQPCNHEFLLVQTPERRWHIQSSSSEGQDGSQVLEMAMPRPGWLSSPGE